MTPELADAFSKISAAALLVLGIWGYATGRVRNGPQVDKDMTQLRLERDEWKVMALEGTERVDRFSRVLEKLVPGFRAPE